MDTKPPRDPRLCPDCRKAVDTYGEEFRAAKHMRKAPDASGHLNRTKVCEGSYRVTKALRK